VGSKATFVIGNDVHVGHYTLIGAELSIAIGERALIAEHCSIRDHEHDVSATSMHSASLVCSQFLLAMVHGLPEVLRC